MSGDVDQVDELDADGDVFGYERPDPALYDIRDQDGNIRVCSRRCHTCILGGEDQAMVRSLRPGRLRQMVEGSREGGIVCHSTFGRGTAALCRGYEEAFGSNLVRVLERLNGLVEVDPEGVKEPREDGDDSAANGLQDQIRGHT